jgi:hypothetical protein
MSVYVYIYRLFSDNQTIQNNVNIGWVLGEVYTEGTTVNKSSMKKSDAKWEREREKEKSVFFYIHQREKTSVEAENDESLLFLSPRKRKKMRVVLGDG